MNNTTIPSFRVIVALRCACEVCCGELITEAQCHDFTSLREAVKAFLYEDLDQEPGPIESSSYPWCPGSWFSRYGTMWEDTPCGEPIAKEISLHLTSVTPASQRRIYRLLEVMS